MFMQTDNVTLPLADSVRSRGDISLWWQVTSVTHFW